MAKRQFKSIDDLRTYIENRVMATMDTTIKTETIEELERLAQEQVYDVYEPESYARRYSFVYDDAYNVDNSGKMKLKITPVVPFNDAYETDNSGDALAGLINYGNGWNGIRYEYTPKGKEPTYKYPRPFLSTVYEELANGNYVARLAEGLEKAGFRVK